MQNDFVPELSHVLVVTTKLPALRKGSMWDGLTLWGGRCDVELASDTCAANLYR